MTKRRDALLVRRAAQHTAAGERIDFATEAIFGPHPYVRQILSGLTMGGPRPRTAEQRRTPANGVLVLTNRRLLVIAHESVVREAPRGTVRISGVGGAGIIPWVDTLVAGEPLRIGFHWAWSARARFVELVSGH